MTEETADLIVRSGLLESPPASLSGLCDLVAEILGDPDVQVEVVVRTGDASVRIAGRGAPSSPDAVVHEVALTMGDGDEFGALRVATGRTQELTAIHSVAAAVATACELEVTRTQLFDAGERVARAEEQVTEAVGQVVHDLNNPLAAAAMSLEIAREQVEDGLVAQLLDRAEGSAAKMKRMTADMLAFAHRPVPGVADVGEVVTRLAAEFEGLPAGAVTAEGDLPVVAISEPDLQVVLVALMENAAKFADEERPLELSVRAEQVSAGWRLVVRDNGRGIAEEDLARVFEPTVRLDRRVPGMGLGLTTVRRLVRSAGGEVGATSRPGVGTEVWFELPV